VIAVIAAAALAPALAGCYAGNGAQTMQPYDPTDGASTVLHDIAIRNVFVLGPPPGGGAIPAGRSAAMFLGLVNNGAPDQLLYIDAPGTASSVKIPHGAVPLSTNQAVLLTGPAPQVILQRLVRPLSAGQFIPMILYFRDAGTISLNVPVLTRAQYYTTYSPPPSPTPTAPRTARATPGIARAARATPGVTASPGTGPRTATPSVSVSPSP
jgi:copper(I)-binding protein